MATLPTQPRPHDPAPARPATAAHVPATCQILGAVVMMRLIAIVPTIYVAICCWEARLTLDPGITAQIMIGAILIVTMGARPQGLLGARRVEVI